MRQIYYYKDYYLKFFTKLRSSEKKKFNWTLHLVSQIEYVPDKYYRSIKESNGLFEIRVESGSNIYRVFCFFDEGNLIILINGFQKKTQKTPRAEIELAEISKNNTTMKKNNLNLYSFTEHLDELYGKRGSAKREKYEQEFEAFKLGLLLQEIRKEMGLTQEQVAEKCGTTKNYISRIENDASDIRLSTLQRIISEGLGARLRLSVEV